MAESYLHRKVINRMRRLRTQNSISSSSHQTTNSMDSKWSPMPSNSNSSPQLDMLRNGGSDLDCQSISSSVGSEQDENSARISGETSTNNTNTSTSTKTTSVTKRLSRSSISKLKIASRAMLFFQRTTNSNPPTLANFNRSSGTGDHATSADNRRKSQLTLQASSGDNSTEGSQQQHHHHQVRTNSNNQVPQLIVPKMNALKLPLVCLIKSLDGELMREVFVHRYELGQYLIESLKVSVGIQDCKYFGLKMAKSFDDQEDLKNVWLDLNESVCKQIKNKTNLINNCNASSTQSSTNPTTQRKSSSAQQSTTNQRSIDFYLRIKFYPPNLARVQDPFLRNYLWLQLRRDLRLGKLTSSMNNLTLLMACVLQFELGDFSEQSVDRIPELNILPNQDLIEEQAIELWSRRLVGFKRHQAQMQFLRVAVILETYGFDYYPVRDHQRQRAYLLGFNYAGIKTIRNGRIVHHFSWHSLSKISYERRMIIFHIYPTENSKRKQILGFKCLSNEDCQSLYMRLLEQKYFFTVDLAYFDKSIRRPTCLYSSPSQTGSSDWPEAMQQTDEPTAAASQQPIIVENRFTSCGPSLDANTGGGSDNGARYSLEAQNSNESGGGDGCGDNSFGSRESQNSANSSQANCYTCEEEQNAAARSNHIVHSMTATGHGQEGGRDCVINGGQQNFGFGRTESNGDDQNYPATSGNNNSNVSLRRTQWHRQQRPRQYFSGEQDQPLRPSDEPTHPAGFMPEPNQGDEGRQGGPESSGRDRRTWAKVMRCIQSFRPSLNGCGGVSGRLAEFAEVLIQPMAATIQCNLADDSRLTGRPIVSSSDGTYFQVIMPTLRFCLMILVMNFVVRWTDSLSSSLIELLSLTPTRN